MGITLKTPKILAALLAAAAFSSCLSDFNAECNTPAGNTDNALVTLSVRVPGGISSATRALGSTQEDEVKELLVLAFEKGADADSDTRLRHVGKSTGIVSDNGTTKQFTVELYSGEWDLMVLANASDIAAAMVAGISGATWETLPEFSLKKSDFQTALTKASTGKWNVDSGDAGKGYLIPMWGMKNAVQVSTASNQIIQTVNLYRMVSKVDVVIQRVADLVQPEVYPGIGLDVFELTHVSLHNYNTRGRLVPGLNPTADGDWTTAGGGAAKRASLPASPGTVTGHAAANRLEWNSAADFTTEKTALEGVIYTFESVAGTSNATRPCIIIGGKYNQSSDVTYYRADFVDAAKNYLPLLRNHHYKMLIRKIGGKGHPSIEDAYIAGPTNIEAEVIPWSDGNMGEIVWDGQYYLSLSEGEVELTREERIADDTDNKLTVKTDVPAGWTATVYDNLAGSSQASSGWLTLSAYSGNGSSNVISLLLDENTGTESRTAYIHIEAGRLTYKAKVVQTTQSNLMLMLRDPATLVEFQEYTWPVVAGTTPDDILLELLWGPRTSNVYISNVKDDALSTGTFVFDTAAGYGSIAAGNSQEQGGLANSGKKQYKIRPAGVSAAALAADPLYDKSSKIEFTVNDGSGVLKKTILLRHWTGYKAAPEVANDYYMDGSHYTFTIRANADFTIAMSSDPGNNPNCCDGNPVVTLDAGVTGTVHSTSLTGTTFGFTVGNDLADPTLALQNVKLIVSSPEGLFADYEFALPCKSPVPVGESNCYMINHSDPMPILIPTSIVSKAMGSAAASSLPTNTGLLGSDWIGTGYSNLKAAPLWSDINAFRNESSVAKVIEYRAGSTISDGEIMIIPGKGEGNMGLALYIDANSNDAYDSGEKIVWSWHLWKVAYFPYASGYPVSAASAAGSGSGNRWMDRNLGALANAHTTQMNLVAGFMYQWGRKDPFPSNKTWTTTFSDYLYYPSSTRYSQIPVSSINMLKSSVGNPLTRYYRSSEPNDWFTNDPDCQNHDLWGGAGTSAIPVVSEDKSIYDPCPEGYKVPRAGAGNYPQSGWSAATNGMTNANAGGYYPGSGCWSTGTENLIEVSQYVGRYWEATPVNGELTAYLLGFKSNMVSRPNYTRGNGYLVRCAAE